MIDGGILSGSEIDNPSIPGTPTAPYEPETIQNPLTSNGSPTVGALISNSGQDVKTGGSVTKDAFIKNTSTVLSLSRYDVVKLAITPGITTISSCVNPLLDPSKIYKAGASCLSGMTGYSLTSDGLAVVIVNDTANAISFTTNISQVNKARRLLVITNSLVSYGASITDLDVSVLSTNSGNYTVRGSVEGPVTSKSNVILPKDAVLLPGSVITYNPTYVSELTNKGRNSLTEIKGLLESKVSWRYE